jgi:hypothetical protein
MKKLFIALSVMAALIFSVAPSQALLGVPDDVPGNDVLMPFFIASMPGHGNVNTLLVMVDFKGGLPAKVMGAAQDAFHYTVFTNRSATVYDDVIKGTPYDMISTDALTIVAKMSAADRAKLEYDLDGDGVDDHYVGYIYFDNETANNSVGAQLLIVDLAAGMASSTNAPVKELEGTAEAFSANRLALSKNLENYGTTATATDFGLYPRYYVNSANAQCYFLMWKSFNNRATPAPGLLPADGTYHVYWYDNEENKKSASFDWPNELLILDVNDYIPAGLWASSTYPKEGFVAFEVPDLSGVGFYGDAEWLGYTWVRDVGTAAESWNVLNQVWRDAWNDAD